MNDNQTKLNELLNNIQINLSAPKSQYNSFSSFNYRSCEDILGAVKPLLDGAVLTFSDEIVVLGERHYLKATARLAKYGESLSTTAFAREALNKKGMDESQITGSSSSYARKYALNGLFAIDDVKDADSTDNTATDNTVSSICNVSEASWYNDFNIHKPAMIKKIRSGDASCDQIIESIEMSGLKISNKTKEDIRGLR